MRKDPVIVPHSRFESLLDVMCLNLGNRVRTPVPLPVVIPSIPFSDFLQLRIADRLGVCMGIDFLTSQDFIHRATGARAEGEWSKRFMVWRVLPYVGVYASKLGVSDPSSRDRFSLAELLADQFDQYGHFRPEILQGWARGKSAVSPKASEELQSDENWQRELWRELRKDACGPHPAEQFEQLKADDAFRARLVKRFPRILIIGSGVIDPLLVKVLRLLADSGSEVEVHVLLPSMEFLGDLRMRGLLPPDELDPETITSEAVHPLLESMGRHAIGTFVLLGQLDEQYSHWPESGGRLPAKGNLLQVLQSDIRSLRRPTSVKFSAEDASIRIHSCFGPRREMEVLKDEIFRAFRDIPGLRPEEVHIVTPSLEAYAPLVTAVLEQGEVSLAIRLMELPAGMEEPAVNAILAFLEMAAGGSFEASWLMELVQLEAVQSRLGVAGDAAGVERLRGWIRRSGVMRGLDASALRPGTWEFARDRLIAGRWVGTSEFVQYPDGSFVLPVASELSGDEELESRFVEWFAALEDTMREWQAMTNPAGWGSRIARACERLLGADDVAVLAIQPQLAFLREVAVADEIDAGVVFDWLRTETRESGRRSQVSGRIPFGRFKQLQNIPCRVLVVVGMQDGAFPATNMNPAWDLLRVAPKVWDRNARIDDRQLFVDALMTPSERLIVTASTRNVRTKKTEPFSSCVDEVLRVTASMGAPRDALVVEHRLQPFAPDYFTNSRTPRSFSSEFAEVAEVLETGGGERRNPFWSSDAEVRQEVPDEIGLDELARFWKDPAKSFLRAQRIVIPGEEEDDEALDRADITVGKPAEWRLKDAIVREIASGAGNLGRVEAVLRADRRLPPGHLGTSAWDTNVAVVDPLGKSLHAKLGPVVSMKYAVPGGPEVAGTVQTTKAGDCLVAYWPLVFKDPKHFLEPWISAVFAAASGESFPTELFDSVNRKDPLRMPAIGVDRARVILSHLVAGFLEGQVRPLCYAPTTSSVLARTRAKSNAEQGISKAAEEWNREDKGHGGGEGCDPHAMWAWRDQDPFDRATGWLEWAGRIAEPLREWSESR